MNICRSIWFAGTLALAAALVGCGGGSAGQASAPVAANTAPVVATGTITGFGSIYVNGVHFQTSTATIHKNGQVADQSQLAVGEIAHVQGSEDSSGTTGVADMIEVDENVIGPVASIDTVNGIVTVLAQSIKVGSMTSFGAGITPADITGLTVGTSIHVDGFTDSTGALVATRIELGTAGETLQVRGIVAGLDTTAHTFKINALTVDYSAATLTGFAMGAPANGDTVIVQGTTYTSATQTLTATQLLKRVSDEEHAGNGGQLEREGLITRFVSATDFDVAGMPVTTTSTTTYRNGTAAMLALNVAVEVRGSLNATNVLVATVVSFHHEANVELSGIATMVNATGNTLTLLGVPVSVTSTTRYEDDGPTHLASFNLASVAVGDTIEVNAYADSTGALVATRLERVPASTIARISGPVASVSGNTFVVAGVSVDATAAMIYDSNEAAMALTAFLAQAAGKSVDVQGSFAGMSLAATKISLESNMMH